jgi:protein SCO1/2
LAWAFTGRSIVPLVPDGRRSLRPVSLAASAVVVLVVLLAGCRSGTDGQVVGSSGAAGDASYQPYVYDPPALAPSLDGLVDTSGRAFSLRDLRGRVVLINFGYTHCPDVCPTTLAIDRQVLRARPDTAAVVFVTVDPERDTVEALASYLRYFEAPIVGLTGDPTVVASVAAGWRVTVVFGPRDAAGNYPVTHSAGTYVVDPDGRLRFLYPYGTPSDVLIGAVDGLVGGS